MWLGGLTGCGELVGRSVVSWWGSQGVVKLTGPSVVSWRAHGARSTNSSAATLFFGGRQWGQAHLEDFGQSSGLTGHTPATRPDRLGRCSFTLECRHTKGSAAALDRAGDASIGRAFSSTLFDALCLPDQWSLTNGTVCRRRRAPRESRCERPDQWNHYQWNSVPSSRRATGSEAAW